MKQLKPYPKYKPSGVEWLRDVPEHWGLKRVRFLTEIKKRIAGELGHDVLSVTQRGIVQKDIESGQGQLSMDYSKYQIVHSGDFAMNHMDLLTGYVDISKYDGVTSPDYRVFTLSGNANCDRFYLYLFQMGYHEKIFFHYGQGSAQLGRWRLPAEAFRELVLPHPGSQEQISISIFLDHETGRIDALMEKKTRFIELLKEKRQALITDAVTGKFDVSTGKPYPAYKSSGVEWLGDVPDEWRVSRLRHNLSSKLCYGANESAESDDPSNPRYIRITDIDGDGNLRGDLFKSLPSSLAAPYMLQDDDVLLARSGATVGKSFIYKIEMDPACYAGYLIRARLNKHSLNPRYFLFCTHSSYYWDFISGSNIQATIQNVSAEKYMNLWLATPSSVLQAKIVEFLDRETGPINTLMEKTKVSIELLNERRSALITATVTGKIDMREYEASY